MTAPDKFAAPGWSADGKPWPWKPPMSWDLCMEDFAEVKRKAAVKCGEAYEPKGRF